MLEALRLWRRRGEREVQKEDPDESRRRQIQNECYWHLINRLNDENYPRAPEDIVLKIAKLTNRGAGKLVPVRAAIELNPDSRLSQALKDIDTESFLKTPAGRTSSCAETIPARTIGLVSDVDNDCEDGLYFIINFPIRNPNSDTYHIVTCWVPTVSYVKGDFYEELDFSLIEKSVKEIAEIIKREQKIVRVNP